MCVLICYICYIANEDTHTYTHIATRSKCGYVYIHTCDTYIYIYIYVYIYVYIPLQRERELTYADVCWRMLAYADVCYIYTAAYTPAQREREQLNVTAAQAERSREQPPAYTPLSAQSKPQHHT
jgi:hypothetical protein